MRKNNIKLAVIMASGITAMGAILGIIMGAIAGNVVGGAIMLGKMFLIIGLLYAVILIFTDIKEDYAGGFTIGILVATGIIKEAVFPLFAEYVTFGSDTVENVVSFALVSAIAYFWVWKNGMKK